MIRFGIVGTGRISDWVLKGAMQDSRIKVVAVCSRSSQAAEAFIERNPSAKDARIYTSIHEMAADPDVDAVYIGTPNQTHCEYTVACLEAGKHVLCEKPLAVSARQGRLMVDAAKRNGKLLMEAMVSTLNPNFRKAIEYLDDISPVRHYSSYFCQYSSKYEALKNGHIASSFQPGTAGALRDVGVYTLYPVVSLFGRPKEVHADLMRLLTEEGETDVHGTLLLKYDGMDASLTFSKVCDSFQPTEISGEKGNVILDEIHIARRAEFVPHTAPTSGLGPKPGRNLISEGLPYNEYYYEFKEFADVIEAGGTESAVNTLDNSIAVLEIIDKALLLK